MGLNIPSILILLSNVHSVSSIEMSFSRLRSYSPKYEKGLLLLWFLFCYANVFAQGTYQGCLYNGAVYTSNPVGNKFNSNTAFMTLRMVIVAGLALVGHHILFALEVMVNIMEGAIVGRGKSQVLVYLILLQWCFVQ